MSDLQELTEELMLDPEFRREYESIQPEMDITRALLDARIRAGMTQVELSEKSGISQADGEGNQKSKHSTAEAPCGSDG